MPIISTLYTIPLIWKVVVDFIILICISFFGAILFFYVQEEGITGVFLYIMCPIFIPMILLCIGLAVYVHTQAVLIDSEKVVLRSFFKTRTLYIKDIQSYSTNTYYIFLHPHEHSLKTVVIFRITGRNAAVVKWIKSHFPDRSDYLSEQEEAAVISDFKFGYSEERRMHALRNASLQAWTLNILSLISAIWIIYEPFGNAILYMAVFMVIPVSILLLFINDGLVRLIGVSGNIVLAISMACMAAGMIAIHANIISYSTLLLPTLLLSTVLFSLLLKANSREVISDPNRKVRSEYIILFIFLLAYSFGLISFLNQYTDTSSPVSYTSKVLSKSIHVNKVIFKSYSLKLSTWTGREETFIDASVSMEEYNLFSAGETVKIMQRQGTVGAEWFLITKMNE